MKTGIVATIGFFDGVHLGHQHLIHQVTNEAKRLGWRSLILSFSCHPRSVFSPDFVPNLLTTTAERQFLLRNCGVDDIHMLEFDNEMATMSAESFMREVLSAEFGVRELVIGYDHHFGRPLKNIQHEEGFKEYREYGKGLGIDVIQVMELPSREHISSSVIRRALLSGDAGLACQGLGRPYRWSGRVIHGQAIGHRLGFPTANLAALAPEKILPANGVYAVWVRVDEDSDSHAPFFRAMLNIGTRPTVGGNSLSIEAHLMDFEGDLYGRKLALYFIERIRTEQQFDCEEDLVRQLKADKLQAMTYLLSPPEVSLGLNEQHHLTASI